MEDQTTGVPRQSEASPASVSSPAAQPAASSGCWTVGFVIILSVWVVLLSLISQLSTWLLDQQIFEGSLEIVDVRWAVDLGFALLVLIPAFVLFLSVRQGRTKAYYRAVSLAALFALFLAPVRLAGITAALLAAAIQIGMILLFLIFLALLFNRRQERARWAWRGLGLALLFAVLIGYPWLAWGALGSLWDTFLNLAVALLFGIAASRILQPSLRAFQVEEHPAQETYRFGSALLAGAAAFLVLLVMVSGLGVNGNQYLLTLVVPILGWGLAALSYRSRSADGRPTSNWPVLALLVGLAVFWPLALIDPDELALVINSAPGELVQWASLAGFVSLGVGVVVSLLLLLVRFLFWPSNPVRALAGIAAVLTWVGAAALYVFIGQPGLYGERLFVILKDQADLSNASQIPDVNQRRQFVYQTLVQHADLTQAGLRQSLDRFGIPYQTYYLENALEIQGGPLVHWWLTSRPEVDRVLSSPILRPLPAPLPPSEGPDGPPHETLWNLTMIGADRVWQDFGVTGQGIIIGQSDSGVQGDHPELADSYRGRDGQNDYNWYDPWNHTQFPTDFGGHGTHTLGTALGNYVGVAPDAEWIGCVNLARNLGNPAYYLNCMQFMLAPFPQNGDPLRDGKPTLGAQVLNNSWGCPVVEGCDPDALQPAAQALRSAGVFVVVSAGNEGAGGCGSVKSPIALYKSVYSVGAVNQAGSLASFSSLGPVEVDGSLRLKPDIAAPGVQILSAYPHNSYEVASGTSMAGPHVVGTVALMWSANPALVGDIDRTQAILDASADPYQGQLPACVQPGTPNNAVGYGLLDTYRAVQAALGK